MQITVVKNKATTEKRLWSQWDRAEVEPCTLRPAERGSHAPTGLGLAGRVVGSHVEALMAKNGDVVGLMVGQREPNQDEAVASAPSSESHTSDCR